MSGRAASPVGPKISPARQVLWELTRAPLLVRGTEVRCRGAKYIAVTGTEMVLLNCPRGMDGW